MIHERELQDIEIRLLLEGIYEVYGYDFRGYAETSLRRRVSLWLAASDFSTFSEAQAHILRDRLLFDAFVRHITVNVSEMFRDPLFFKALRTQVVPFLKTYPSVRVWHAGCATGEEAYSMAILFNEEGLQGRYRIYATDLNEEVLERAQQGIFPLAEMQKYTRNYQNAGGLKSFADYYIAQYDRAMLLPLLREQILFSAHNLTCDAEFGEMNMVICRNVMIYFKQALKNRVLHLFDNCLLPGGFLCLGTKETLELSEIDDGYKEIAHPLRIYRKSYA